MTHALWCSLYLTCADKLPTQQALVDGLLDSLAAQGYTPYNPFGLLPGKSYSQTVKLFVAPPTDGWVRVLCAEPVPLVLAKAVPICTTLYIVVSEVADVRVFADGEAAPPTDALLPHLRDGKTANDLHHAIYAPGLTVLPTEGAASGDVPLDVLPEAIQKMAGNVDAKALDKMFGKFSKQLLGKAGGDANAASDLLNQSRGVDWSSAPALRVRALMTVLAVPDNWRTPDFATLRDAYSLHARHQRNPNARLYPGDAEAMQAVPNALDYVPVYAGKDA
jgi:hypothetical protein